MADLSFLDEYDKAKANDLKFLDDYDKIKNPSLGTKVGNAISDIGVTTLKSAVGVPELGLGLADIPTGGRAGKFAQDLGFDARKTKDYLDTLYSPRQQQANQAVNQAEGFVPTLKAYAQNPSTLFHNIGEQALPILTGGGISQGLRKLAPSLSAPVAGAAGEALVTAGQNIEQVRQESPNQLLDFNKQTLPILASSALTGGIAAGSGKLAQKLGYSDLENVLAGGARQAGSRNIGRIENTLASAGLEGITQELPQSLQEQVAINYANDKPLAEGVGNAAAQGLLLGGAMGGATGLAQGPLTRAANKVINPAPEPTGEANVTPTATGQKFDEAALNAAINEIEGQAVPGTTQKVGQIVTPENVQEQSGIRNDSELQDAAIKKAVQDEINSDPRAKPQAIIEKVTEILDEQSNKADKRDNMDVLRRRFESLDGATALPSEQGYLAGSNGNGENQLSLLRKRSNLADNIEANPITDYITSRQKALEAGIFDDEQSNIVKNRIAILSAIDPEQTDDAAKALKKSLEVESKYNIFVPETQKEPAIKADILPTKEKTYETIQNAYERNANEESRKGQEEALLTPTHRLYDGTLVRQEEDGFTTLDGKDFYSKDEQVEALTEEEIKSYKESPVTQDATPKAKPELNDGQLFEQDVLDEKEKAKAQGSGIASGEQLFVSDTGELPITNQDDGTKRAPDRLPEAEQSPEQRTDLSSSVRGDDALRTDDVSLAKEPEQPYTLNSGRNEFSKKEVDILFNDPKKPNVSRETYQAKETFDGSGKYNLLPIKQDDTVQENSMFTNNEQKEESTDTYSKDIATQEVPVANISLSKDVPQFKTDANEKGVVEKLTGNYERTGTAPIQLWQRKDGRLEVISGRHRYELAQRTGEKTIPGQIHKEEDGFTKQDAMRLDAELNIRDGQGKVKDYVNYFKATGINQQEADRRGLIGRALGRTAFGIATNGSEETVSALRNDAIKEQTAYTIATSAPNDPALQAVGIKSAQDGKSDSYIANQIKAVRLLRSDKPSQTNDLFGFDDSAMKEAEALAKKATEKQSELIALRKAAKIGVKANDLQGKTQGKVEVKIKNKAELDNYISGLDNQIRAWDNWHTNPELLNQLKGNTGIKSSKLVGNLPSEEQLLTSVNAIGSNTPKKQYTETDLFVNSKEEQQALDAKQQAFNLSASKDKKRNGDQSDPVPLFSDNAGITGQQDITDKVKFSKSESPQFYSQLRRSFESAPDKVFATGKQAKAWMKSNAPKLGVKSDEIYWSGVEDYLDANPKASKQDVIKYLDENGVKTEDYTSKVKDLDGNETLLINNNLEFAGIDNKAGIKKAIYEAVKNNYSSVAIDKSIGISNKVSDSAVSGWVEISKPDSIRNELKDNFGSELASMIPLKVVDTPVLLSLKNDKIRQEVIKSIPVNVVNILSNNNVSANDLLSNPDVVTNRLPVNVRSSVARGLASSLKLVGTRLRTTLNGGLSLESARGKQKDNPTVSARNLDLPIVVGLLSPSKFNRFNKLFGDNSSSLGTKPNSRAFIGAESPLTIPTLIGESPKFGSADFAKFLNSHPDYKNVSLNNINNSTSNQNNNKFLNEISEKFGGQIGTIKLDTGNQPALIITPEMKAKILGEGVPLFSQTKKATGSTKAQVESWLDSKDKTLIKSGRLNIAETKSEIPKGLVSIDASGVEGFYDPKSKQTWVVAENVSKDTIRSVLNHEYLHASLDTNPKLKDRLTKANADTRTIFNDVEKGIYTGKYKEVYDAALRRVDRAKTSQDDRFEEFLAYAITEHSKSPKSLPEKLTKAIQNIIAAIKAAIFRHTGYIGNISPADLTALARSYAKASEIPASSSGVSEKKTTQSNQKFSIKDDIKDFLTQSSTNVISLADMDTVLTTGKMPRAQYDYQQFKDKAATLLIDSTRPFDIEIRKFPNVVDVAKVINAKDLAKGKTSALEKEAMRDFVQPLAEKIKALTKTTGFEFRAVQQIIGEWASARYAIEKNGDYIRQDQEAVDDAQEALDADPTNSQLKSALTKAKTNQQKRLDAINEQKWIDAKEEGLSAKLAGGYNNFTAQEQMRKYEAIIPKKDLESAAQHIYDLMKWKVDLDLKTGKVTQEQVDKWFKSPYYVPLTGDPSVDNSEDELFQHGGVNQAGDKAAKGRQKSKAQSGIDAAIEQVQKSTRYAGWNDFKDSLNNLYNNLIQEELDNGATMREAIINIKDQYNIVKKPISNDAMLPSTAITYRKNGKNYYFDLGNQAAIDALKSINKEQIPSILQPVANFTRLSASLVTTTLPGFAQINAIRDVWERSENIRTRVLKDYPNIDMNKVGKDAVNIAFNSLSPTNNLVKKIASVMLEGTKGGEYLTIDNNDPDIKLIKEMLETGAGSTWGDYFESTNKTLATQLQKSTKLTSKTIEYLNAYNNSFELISSFAVYKALKQNGVTDKNTAGAATLNLMNFNKSGTATGPLRALYMFVNPALQGAQQMGLTLSTKQGKARAAAYLIGGMALYAALRAMGGDDDDLGVNKMDSQSSFVTERNISIPIGNDEFIKVPVGFGMPQLMWSTATNLVKAMAGSQDGADTAAEIIKSFMRVIAPVAPSETAITDHPIFWMAQSATPQIAKPLMNVGLGINAFGQPLTNSKFENPSVSRALQGRKSTPEEYKEMAQVLGRMGIKMYPEEVRELVNGYGLGPIREYIIKPMIENPNKEKLGRKTISTAVDRWVSAYDKAGLKERLYYRMVDEANEASIKKSLGSQLSPREQKLATLNDVVTKMNRKASGKLAAATKAEKSKKNGDNFRKEGEKIKENAMNIMINGYKSLPE